MPDGRGMPSNVSQRQLWSNLIAVTIAIIWSAFLEKRGCWRRRAANISALGNFITTHMKMTRRRSKFSYSVATLNSRRKLSRRLQLRIKSKNAISKQRLKRPLQPKTRHEDYRTKRFPLLWRGNGL